MKYRVVIPRTVASAESNKIQQVAWRRGYGTRIAGRAPGSVVVEFLEPIDELPDPSEIRAHEDALERVLSPKQTGAAFSGRGAWLETVQNRERRVAKER